MHGTHNIANGTVMGTILSPGVWTPGISESSHTSNGSVGHAVVVGGGGFVGTALVRRLLTAGWSVEVVDNFTTGRAAPLCYLIDDGWPLKVYPETATLATYRKLGPVPDVVFHLATANEQRAEETPILEMNAAFLASTDLAEWIRERKISPKVVFVSTMSVYGNETVVEREEGDELWPETVYGIVKLATEKYWDAQTDINSITVRPSNVYGPGMNFGSPWCGVVGKACLAGCRHTALPIFDVTNTRDYTYIDDVIDGILMAYASPKDVAWFGPFDLGTGVEYTLLDVIDCIPEDVNFKFQTSPRSAERVNRRVVDPTKAKEFLGWSPKTKLEVGVVKTYNAVLEWEKTNRHRRTTPERNVPNAGAAA